MENPNDTTGDTTGDSVAEASSMAYAASEAAKAAAAIEAQEDLATRACRICNKGGEDGRAMIHFPPVEVDVTVAQIAPQVTTFTEDLAMHVFCGKTASILPNVNMPQYEILSKAGIKNKHGIGTEINTALARTRCATVAAPGAKEKQFYLVQEFEAIIAAIRFATGSLNYQQQQQHPQSQEITIPAHPHHMYAQAPMSEQFATSSVAASGTKVVPAKAGKTAAKAGRNQEQVWVYPAQSEVQVNADGKVQCACGGTHLPTGTAKGVASWRSHVMTKRHQKWMEDNGLLGAV